MKANLGINRNNFSLYRNKTIRLDATVEKNTEAIIPIERSEQRNNGEDARAALSDKQMRTGPRYPVDRYLVESSKNIEMVNIIDDDIWDPEPALRPEDEIILRKLHDMLQSTADDLKLLSGELSKFHEPGVQIKTAPIPLDEEFNEKVHIEELVNAKFHGYKIVDKSTTAVGLDFIKKPKPLFNVHRPKVNNTGVQVNVAPTLLTKPVNRHLGISRTKVIQISDKKQDNKNNEKLNNCKVMNNAPAVVYNELCYKYVEPKINISPQKVLQVQEMPSINIRSELKEQKVVNIDILPERTDSNHINSSKNNVSVVTVQHETEPKQVPVITTEPVQYIQPNYNKPVRKVYKISSCDSSGSTNKVSSVIIPMPKDHKTKSNTVRFSPKSPQRVDRKKKESESHKHSEKHLNLEEWKNKLNKVYGPSTAKKKGHAVRTKSNKGTITGNSSAKPSKLNNAEYIPYSQLTLGGVRISDLEKEIPDIPNRNDVPLSPILDKILSSCENSPRHKSKETPRVLTTSDENLLQEVLDIEKTISETISKSTTKKTTEVLTQRDATDDSDTDEHQTYVDDFEDEKSEQSNKSMSNSTNNDLQSNFSKKSATDQDSTSSNDNVNLEVPGTSKIQNITYTKTSNLSFKDSVDIFEFIHSVDKQDTGTQSAIASIILPKETQTSPRNDKPNIQPIHNDLWPSIDPSGEVENLFKLEKEFIKKLIIDEYGDLLEKNFTKPSTSKDSMAESDKNVAAFQKNTQTSPARVKNVMTSPKRTKTRTTSPFALSVPIDHQTSPIILVTQDQGVNVNISNDDCDISVNLSSPRFSLRLPQTTRDVLSQLGSCSKTPSKIESKSKTLIKSITQSSTSIDADNSSSEISSLGEVKLKLNRKLKGRRVPTISESSTTSSVSQYSSDIFSGGILPLRSEGEITGQGIKKNHNSDGETSFDLLG